MKIIRDKVLYFVYTSLGHLKVQVGEILNWLLVRRNAVMGALNLGVVLLSVNTLTRVEKSSKEADLAFKKCEALLRDRSPDIPVTVEASVTESSSVLPTVGGIVLILVLITFLYFGFFHGAKGTPPAPPEYSYQKNSLVRKGLETNFKDTSMNLEAVLIKHPEGDSTLLVEDGEYKTIAELGREYVWPAVPATTPVTTGVVPEALSTSPASEMITTAVEVLGTISISLLVIGTVMFIAEANLG